MAAKKPKRKGGRAGSRKSRKENAMFDLDESPPTEESTSLPTGPTGRFLVTLRRTDQQSLIKSLRSVAGISAASSVDWKSDAAGIQVAKQSDVVFEHLGVAVVEAEPSQVRALSEAVSDNENPILAVEPEEYVQIFEEVDDSTISLSELQYYLRGHRDAIEDLLSRFGSPAGGEAEDVDTAAGFADTPTLTWGLQATLASNSGCSGRGIRVAVLDTGFDLAHVDFVGRSPITASFVPNEPVQDGHSHGTHCIGTACGPRVPASGVRRYGVASESVILAGKVLSNGGSGQDGWILAGINWAVGNQAVIVSMSLGAAVSSGGGFKQAYEQAALSALAAGTLIIAAAGNRSGQPVSSPANCPSILAVSAVDSNLQLASFSNIGINPNGGEINLAGPGAATFSSVPMPTSHGVKSGTSMATPHVAGCAALLAQNTGLRGQALWTSLLSTARNIGLPTQHMGAGLVQAPLCRRNIIVPRRLPNPIRRPFPIIPIRRFFPF